MTGEMQLVLALVIVPIQTVLIAAVFYLWAEVRALKNSTHTIQYIDPLSKDKVQDVTDAVKSKLHEDSFDNII